MIYVFTVLITMLLAFVFHVICNCPGERYVHGTRAIDHSPMSWRIDGVLPFAIMVMPSALVAGLRHGISVDYFRVYQQGFYNVLMGFYSVDRFEIGFRYLILACNKLANGPWFMFLVVSLLTVVNFFCAAKDSSRSFLMSVALFFAIGTYFDAFNGIRQYLAVSMFVYAYRYVRDGDLPRYLACLFLAATFHTSALFLIPAFWLRSLDLSIAKWGVVVAVIGILSPNIVDAFTLILSNIDKYNEYIVRNTLLNYVNFSASGLAVSLISTIPILFNYTSLRETAEGRFIVGITMVCLCVVLLSGSLPLAERLLYYPKSMLMISIPNALASGRTEGEGPVLSLCILGMLASMTTIGIAALGWYAILPYQSIV